MLYNRYCLFNGGLGQTEWPFILCMLRVLRVVTISLVVGSVYRKLARLRTSLSPTDQCAGFEMRSPSPQCHPRHSPMFITSTVIVCSLPWNCTDTLSCWAWGVPHDHQSVSQRGIIPTLKPRKPGIQALMPEPCLLRRHACAEQEVDASHTKNMLRVRKRLN